MILDIAPNAYTSATLVIRVLNNRRHRLRALAASHLIRSLIWALAVTTVIFAADKIGIFARAIP